MRWLVVASILTACSTSDIRPRGIPSAPNDENSNTGRDWLRRAFAAQGGKAALHREPALRLQMRDPWLDSLARMVASPWDEDGELVQLDLQIGTDNARLTFLEGEHHGDVWGLQNWVTYRIEGESEPEFDDVGSPDGTQWFWLPTLAFFPLAAEQLQSATHVQFAGIRERGTRDHAVVYATWNTLEPQDDIDQYVVWIDAETERIRFIEYTVRDMSSSLSATAAYENYELIGDFALPRRITLLGDNGRPVHRITIEHAEFVELGHDYFVPRPDLRSEKSAGR